MRVGNYSVLIPEGVERESGHVSVEHGKQYTLRLMSHDYRRCDAEVEIDGKSLGGFRLHGYGSITLERSPEDSGRFTFYSSGTVDAGAAGEAGIAAADKGLIQVRFVPERRTAPPVPRVQTMGMRGGPCGGMRGGPCGQPVGGGLFRSAGPLGFTGDREEKTSGGITGLSGHSAQQFVTVGPLDRAKDESVTITLRLVTLDAGPRPLKPVSDRANPVPAPVG